MGNAPEAPEDLEAALAAWETDVLLADGSTAHLRPIRPSDRDRLEAFHGRQSPESIYFRYFRFRPELSDAELEHFTNVDYFDRMAFVVVRGDDLIAVARYEPWTDRNEAEVAFFVDDAYRGRGLATILLEFLAAAGRRRQLDGFTATVLPENYGMLRVFRKAGFDVTTKFADGVIEVTLGIDVTDDAQAAIGARFRRSTVRSVARMLEPTSIVMVGASRRPGSVGHEVLRHLAEAPFAGSLSLVHPEADAILGIDAHRRIGDIEPAPDLAIIAVPAASVASVIEDCVDAGVGSALVFTAGFSDAGPEGAELERRLLATVRDAGVRMVGPNAFGLANTDPEVNLQALFLPVKVVAGHVGLLSQSGPLGAAVLDDLARAGVGISSFAALGNRADVSVNDLLHYWAVDERTKAIALYIENFGNLRTFTALAREISPTKPILAVASPDDDLNELLRQSGVILVDQISDLADHARFVVDQPLPAGRRAAVVSNTSSVARLAVAACRRSGLEIAGPDGEALLIEDVEQPTSGSEHLSVYERAVVRAALSADVDAVLVALVPSLHLPANELVELLQRVDRAVTKPIVAAGLVTNEAFSIEGIPTFRFPEGAAGVLGRFARHAEWRQSAEAPLVEATEERAATIVATVSELLGERPAAEGRDLTDAESQRLLDVIGVPYAAAIDVADADEAIAAAESLGFPVALKGRGLAHRTAGESGGTALDIQQPEQLVDTLHRMREQFGDDLDPVTVQVMVPSGLHLQIDLVQDFERGASLAISPGGAIGGLVGRQVRALPASRADLRALCSAPWLVDSAGPDTRAAVEDMLVALAEAAAAAPELAELELNPVLAGPDGAVAVDGRLRLRPWPTSILDGLRHV
ncbi:MAG: GNAT family N-acetyltransferase [Acidimicrobiales bacterium]